MESSELLKLVEESKKTDLQAILSAKESAKKSVLDDPSAANLAALDKANKMLQDMMAPEAEPSFENRKEVLKHLKILGYKVSKSKLYNDADPKKGPPKLRMESNGSVLESSVKAYIKRAGLQLPGSDHDQGSDLSVARQERELEKLEEQIAKLRFEREALEGKHMPITDFEMEVAARTVVFESGLRYDYQTNVNEWVMIEDPNVLLEVLNSSLNEKLNEFASMKTFQVIFLERE